MARKEMNTTVMMMRCTVRVSADGPTRIRRSRASGFVRIKYTLGIQLESANTARKTQACQ